MVLVEVEILSDDLIRLDLLTLNCRLSAFDLFCLDNAL